MRIFLNIASILVILVGVLLMLDVSQHPMMYTWIGLVISCVMFITGMITALVLVITKKTNKK